jgi:hypothetical protein
MSLLEVRDLLTREEMDNLEPVQLGQQQLSELIGGDSSDYGPGLTYPAPGGATVHVNGPGVSDAAGNLVPTPDFGAGVDQAVADFRAQQLGLGVVPGGSIEVGPDLSGLF